MTSGNGKASGKALVPQAHGGALQPGAGGGRKNGLLGGRPPSAIREYCRGAFADRIPILEKIADGEPLPMKNVVDGVTITAEVSASIRDRAQAIDMLAKYGGVDKLALSVEEQPEERMTPERRDKLWAAIQRIKTVEQLERMLTGGATNGDGP